jgi:hypothetical protein
LRARAAARQPGGGSAVTPAATYWRRRLVALAVGMAALALISWALSGALGGGGASSASGSSGHGAQHGGSGHGGSQGSGGHGSSGGQGGAGQGGGSQGSGSAGSAVGTGSASAGASDAADTRHGRHHRVPTGPQPCAHGDVVLSLFSSQESYADGQLPQFTVDVVATGGPTCTFNVGARHVTLIIRSGSVRVWNSGDCASGTGDLNSDLQRGVPTVLPITWNRQASAPGCPPEQGLMPAGTYTAEVSDGWLASNVVSFRIS